MSKREAVIDLVCAQREQMRVIIALLIVVGLLLALSLPFVEPGDQVFPIVVIDAVLVVGAFAFFSFSFWYCTKREMDE
jgi:hypothetical protein